MKVQKQVISEIIDNPNKIVVSNPMTVLRFNKPEGKAFVPVTTQEIGVFIPKIVWETISLLSTTDFPVEGDIITKRIYLRDFIRRIGGNEKKYEFVIDAARVLRAWEIASINDKGQEVYRGFFNDVIHDKKSGYIDFKISKEWAMILLDIAQNGNVSFLKQRIFDLQNSHAINLYPTLKAQAFRKKFSISIDDFRKKFGYATTGYNKYSNLYVKVIQPALDELNAKSDLMVTLEVEGTNLQGAKPRITGVVFLLKEKSKEPQEETVTAKPEKAKILVIDPNIPNITEIQKIGINAGFTEENCSDILDICDNNYVRAWEMIKGYLEVKDKGQPILRPLGYIFKGKDSLGAGLWAKHLTSVSKVDSKKREQLLRLLKDDYYSRKQIHFAKCFEMQSDLDKERLTNIVKNEKQYVISSRNIAINENGVLNEIGIEIAGEIVATEKGQGIEFRQDFFRNFVWENHKIEIQFNDEDEVVIN